MCYSNCPYENYHGECKAGKIKPSDAHCMEPEREYCPECGSELRVTKEGSFCCSSTCEYWEES